MITSVSKLIIIPSSINSSKIIITGSILSVRFFLLIPRGKIESKHSWSVFSTSLIISSLSWAPPITKMIRSSYSLKKTVKASIPKKLSGVREFTVILRIVSHFLGLLEYSLFKLPLSRQRDVNVVVFGDKSSPFFIKNKNRFDVSHMRKRRHFNYRIRPISGIDTFLV